MLSPTLQKCTAFSIAGLFGLLLSPCSTDPTSSSTHGAEHTSKQPGTPKPLIDELGWGDETGKIQTALVLRSDQKTGKGTLVCYARNGSDREIVIDADRPIFNESGILFEDPRGKQSSSSMWVFKRFKLTLPPNQIRGWEFPADSHLHFLREPGRYRLFWQLKNAVSKPIHVDVKAGHVTVFRDQWKTVDFRFPLEQISNKK